MPNQLYFGNPLPVYIDLFEGHPGWAFSFIISAFNSSCLFSPVRFKVEDLGEADALGQKTIEMARHYSKQGRPQPKDGKCGERFRESSEQKTDKNCLTC